MSDCGNYSFNFKFQCGGVDLNNTKIESDCADINLYRSVLMVQIDSEMAMRLMNKGLFPINANMNGVEVSIYMKDVHGRFIGTSVNTGYVLRPNKPNNKLTKLERQILKEHNLYEQFKS